MLVCMGLFVLGVVALPRPIHWLSQLSLLAVLLGDMKWRRSIPLLRPHLLIANYSIDTMCNRT